MERALVQGEHEAELMQLQQEQKMAQQLQEKLSGLDAAVQRERDKVNPAAGASSRLEATTAAHLLGPVGWRTLFAHPHCGGCSVGLR